MDTKVEKGMEFKCALCNGVFVAGRTSEEAEKEAVQNNFDVNECDVVCDDCYNKVMNWAAKKN